METYGYEMEDLVPLVGKLAEKYTSGDSTSVSYEKARELMDAVLYCIGQWDGGSDNGLRAKECPADEAYKVGYQIVLKKTEKAKKLYNQMILSFYAYENEILEDTVKKGLPQFFKRYRPLFRPGDHILTLDYPVLEDIIELSGIDRILSYLLQLDLEQKFLSGFPREYVLYVLENSCDDYRQQVINLTEVLFRNIFGSVLAQKSVGVADYTETEIRQVEKILKETEKEELKTRGYRLAEGLVDFGYEGDGQLSRYLKLVVADMVSGLKNAAEQGSLKNALVFSER